MFVFLDYFGAVFTPTNFLILFAGTCGGLVMGALPGLSPTMAVALLIPFTFHMEAAPGLILLGAVYTSTVAGGAISAILLKIPGAPANIATALDGHEMAKRGRAASALQLSFLSSGVGGVLGVFVLIFFTPTLAEWALNFGPSHLFWLAILGVTVIASLATESVIKGLAAGCLGLFVAFVGYDDVHGVDRFVFFSGLEGGVHIIPALVGLFAIPQVLNMFSQRQDGALLRADDSPSLWQSARLMFGKVKTICIGSVVGVVVGLAPGAGGQIAGLVAYDQSRKLSRRSHNYGKGEEEGLIAAETANNAMVGPSLVPLLTLSVPGSPTAAVLLGGLLIHGIFPGPSLFSDYPEVSWTFINALLVGQILMAGLGLLLAKYAARVVLLPKNHLAAAVVVLAVFGTYSVQHSYSDVIVMAALGGGMWLLERHGFAAGPLVLGIVLGPIAEQNFVYGHAIAVAGDGAIPYFLSGAGNLALIAIIVLSVVGSVWMEKRARARRRAARKPCLSPPPRRPQAMLEPAAAPAPAAWRRALAPAMAGNWAVFALAALALAASWLAEEPEAYLFPRLVSALLAVFAVVNLWRAVVAAEKPAGLPPALLRQIAPGAGLIVVFVAVAETAGFYFSSFFVYFALAYWYNKNKGARAALVCAVVAVVVVLLLYAVFSVLLQVQTPRGWLV